MMATVIDAAADTDVEKRDKKGKGLVWSEDELMAIARAASIACQDPAVGSQMNMAQLGRKIRTAFITDEDRPEKACSTSKDGGALDNRRWDGRSAEACLKMWQRLRRECTRFKGIHDRINGLQLTGNPSEAALLRCASLEFSEGRQVPGHLYDCINNREYFIRKPFMFVRPYLFLSSSTKLISGVALHAAENDGEENSSSPMKRPIGTKKAKAEGQVKKTTARRSMPESVDMMANAMTEMQKTAREKQEFKQKMEMRKLDFEQQRFWYERADALFGASSSAPEEQRQEAARLMRKRVLSSLALLGDGCADGGSAEVTESIGGSAPVAAAVTERAEAGNTSESLHARVLTEDMDTQAPPSILLQNTHSTLSAMEEGQQKGLGGGRAYADTPFMVATDEVEE